MFLTHLKVLLWKNIRLKARRPWGTVVEIFVPLTLFVLLAWVRTRVPVVENFPNRPFPFGQTSSGPVGVLQGYLCGGEDFDASTPRPSALQQALDIFERRNISWEAVQPVLKDLSAETHVLADTLDKQHQEYVSVLGQERSVWDLDALTQAAYSTLQAVYSTTPPLRDLAVQKPVRRSSTQALVITPSEPGDLTPQARSAYSNPSLPHYYTGAVTMVEDNPWLEIDLEGLYEIGHIDLMIASTLLTPPPQPSDPKCIHWLPQPDADAVKTGLRLFNSTLVLSAQPFAPDAPFSTAADTVIPLVGATRLPEAELTNADGSPAAAALLSAADAGSTVFSQGVVADLWGFDAEVKKEADAFLSTAPRDDAFVPDRTLRLESMQFQALEASASYAVRMHAVLRAPISGNYTLLMVSDYHSDLWVGHMENSSVPQTMRRILHLTQGGPARDYKTPADPIYLAKGALLYVEARAVRSSLCGHLSVAVILPNDVTLDPIPAALPSRATKSVYRVVVPLPEDEGSLAPPQTPRRARYVRMRLDGLGALAVRDVSVFARASSTADGGDVIANQVSIRSELVRACSALRIATPMRTITQAFQPPSTCMQHEALNIDPTALLLGHADIADDIFAQILRSCGFRAAGLPKVMAGAAFSAAGLAQADKDALVAALTNAAAASSSSFSVASLRSKFAQVLNSTTTVSLSPAVQLQLLDMLTGVVDTERVDVSLCEDASPEIASDDSLLVLRTQACLESIQRTTRSLNNVLGAMQEMSTIPAIARIIGSDNYDVFNQYAMTQLVCPSRAPVARQTRRAEDDPNDSPDIKPSRGLWRIMQYALNPNTHIHYSPNTPAVTNLMRLAIKPFYQAAAVVALTGCITGNNVDTPDWREPLSLQWADTMLVGFPDEATMIANSMDSTQRFSVLAAVAFHNITGELELPRKLSYSIRMEENHVPDTRFLKPRSPIETRWGRKTWFRYYYSGFLLVQDAIDRAFVDVLAGRHIAAPLTYTNEMTTPAYLSDPFTNSIAATLPLFMVLAWIYSVSMLVKSVVYEKEHRLREAMKMMGLGSTVHFLGWLLTSLVFLTLSVTMMTMLLCLGGVLPQSNPLLVWCFLELFALSSIALSFLISCFFDKAKLASACAGIIYFVLYLPYVFLSLNENGVSYAARLWASLSSTTAFGLGCEYLAKFERLGSGANFHNLNQGMDDCDEFTLGTAMGMMLLDIVLYSSLTWYLTEAFPGEYGIPRPWYFPLTRTYWRGERTATSRATQDTHSGRRYLPEAVAPCAVYEPSGHVGARAGVQLRNLVKTYHTGSCNKGDEVRAVRGVTMDIYETQITALLGHNGAGKTTLMSILTGLFPPTQGTVLVNGLDVQTQLPEIRKSLGVCPQYNVLFEDLSALEHLLFCARLKGLTWKDAREQATSFLSDLGLLKDQHTLSKNLSGGMKRKLSVCMAFIGGSKLVILDEPSAGMDPHARRSCWDLLLKYRKDRTVIISTHHLDEADLLGDRVAIMANGQLRCMGSSLFLKRHYGAGYHITVSTAPGADIAPLKAFFVAEEPQSSFLESKGSDTTFWLPGDRAESFAALFERLEVRRAELQIDTYGVTASTLEEVFLKVSKEAEDDEQEEADEPMLQLDDGLAHGDEEQEDEDEGANSDVGGDLNTDSIPLVPQAASARKGRSNVKMSRKRVVRNANAHHAAYDVADEAALAERIQMGQYSGATIKGWRLSLRIFWALFLKRFHTAKRDRKAVLSQILLPAAFVTIAMAVAVAFPPQDQLPPRELTVRMFSDSCEAAHEANFVPFVSESNATVARNIALQIPRLAQGLDLARDNLYLHPRSSCGLNCSYPRNFSSYTLDTFSALGADRKGAITLQDISDPSPGVLAGEGADGEAQRLVMRAWFDSRWSHSMPAFLNLANNALLRAVVGADDVSITTFSHPINRTLSQRTAQYLKSGTDLTVAINIIIAMSFVPASFVVFLVWERANKSKHLQFVSGVSGTVYWLSNFAWDLVNYLVPCLISMIIFHAFGLPAYTGRNFTSVCMLLLLYGWSVTPLMYPASWLFSVPSTAYVTLICINLFTGLTCTLATFMLELFASDPYMVHLNSILRWVFLLFPNYALGRGLMDMARNEYYSQYYAIVEGDTSHYKDPMQWSIIGKNLVFMLVEGLVYFLATLLIERLHSVQLKQLQRGSGRAPVQVTDTDVVEERRAVKAQGRPGHGEVLFVNGLTRVYRSRGKAKTAVNDLCFRVPRGECFGLLGVNGAGKTSTFKMITGDISVTRGDAWVDANSILTAMGDVRQTLGYTPQFDALSPLLTGRETLAMYARVRGVPEHAIRSLVSHAIANLNLNKWADRVSQTYSGGNKRKLSVAVALLGRPQLLLLDEPTAGVDAQSRRFLWQVILAVVRSGRSVLLTSHAMDECQALCGRIAIMVNGELQCLGSSQHLKDKYGAGYTIVLKVRSAGAQQGACSSEPLWADAAPIKAFFARHFPGAVLDEEHNGYFQYTLPRTNMPQLAEVFRLMEICRRENRVEDYSVSQTSLDSVFCKFADMQDSERADNDGDEALNMAPLDQVLVGEGEGDEGDEVEISQDEPLLS